MQMLRQIYESVPNVIPVPAALRRRRVEVIMLPLDEVETPPVLSDEAQQQALQQLMQHAEPCKAATRMRAIMNKLRRI